MKLGDYSIVLGGTELSDLFNFWVERNGGDGRNSGYFQEYLLNLECHSDDFKWNNEEATDALMADAQDMLALIAPERMHEENLQFVLAVDHLKRRYQSHI